MSHPICTAAGALATALEYMRSQGLTFSCSLKRTKEEKLTCLP